MEYREIVVLIGRVLLGFYFLKSAWNHFVNHKALAGYAGSMKVPAPTLAVLGSGILLLAGGVGILTGRYVDWAVGALVLFFVPVTFTMHRYWTISDPMMKMNQSINFWKNLAVLGAVLMLLAIPQPWMYTL